MPLHIRRQAGPVDHDEKLRQTRQPLPCECSIEVKAVRFEMGVAEQSINTDVATSRNVLDAMAHADCAGGANSQGNEAERMSVD